MSIILFHRSYKLKYAWHFTINLEKISTAQKKYFWEADFFRIVWGLPPEYKTKKTTLKTLKGVVQQGQFNICNYF